VNHKNVRTASGNQPAINAVDVDDLGYDAHLMIRPRRIRKHDLETESNDLASGTDQATHDVHRAPPSGKLLACVGNAAGEASHDERYGQRTSTNTPSAGTSTSIATTAVESLSFGC
jgi:hypothetical protein